jgi:hypothetical protein
MQARRCHSGGAKYSRTACNSYTFDGQFFSLRYLSSAILQCSTAISSLFARGVTGTRLDSVSCDGRGLKPSNLR